MQYYTNDTFCLIPLYALLGIAFHVSELAKRGRGQGHSTKYGPLSIAFHLVYQVRRHGEARPQRRVVGVCVFLWACVCVAWEDPQSNGP